MEREYIVDLTPLQMLQPVIHNTALRDLVVINMFIPNTPRCLISIQITRYSYRNLYSACSRHMIWYSGTVSEASPRVAREVVFGNIRSSLTPSKQTEQTTPSPSRREN
jgi:hypothetical protein